METLSRWLSGTLAMPVSDRTGVGGNYDFKIEFQAQRRPGGGFEPAPIIKALHDQLGLQLDLTTGPVPAFLIERVEKPTIK